MDSLTVLDFERARDIATQCLFRANALIRAAHREPHSFPWAGNTLVVNHLAPEVGSFCDFLEASRPAIGRVQPYTQLVVTEPVRHGGLCYATAHDLAWAFAHTVWLGVANVVSTALVMAGRSDDWTATSTLLLDRALVDEHLSEIRDRLCEKPPIDAPYFAAMIRIESRKAVAAFKAELDSSPKALRDYGLHVDADRSFGQSTREGHAHPVADLADAEKRGGDLPDSSTPGARRGKAGTEKWRRATDKMMVRLAQGTLPKSLRDTRKAIDETYDTTRRAAHKSDALRIHFNLQAEADHDAGANVLDELASQADRRTQRAISQMTPTQRRNAEDALRSMPAASQLELLRTLAVDPDGGRTGDVSLIENADEDTRIDRDWSG